MHQPAILLADSFAVKYLIPQNY